MRHEVSNLVGKVHEVSRLEAALHFICLNVGQRSSGRATQALRLGGTA